MKKKALFVILALFLGFFGAFTGGTRMVEASSQCTINSFYPSQNNISSGGSTTLIINASGCQNLVLSGGVYTNSQIGTTSSFTVGPLYSTTTFSLTGYDYYNNATYATTIVTVGGNGNGYGYGGSCVLNNFYATPTQVSSGQYSTLTWSTTGCTSVSVMGPGVNSYTTSNSVQVGPVYGTSTYTLTGTGSSYSNSINQTVVVSTNNSSTGQSNPTVTTYAPTDMTNTTATFNGYITANNNYYNNNCSYSYYGNTNCGGYTSYYFEYGPNQYSFTNQTPTQTFNSGSGSVSAYVSNLQPGTLYYAQLVALGSNGINSYGGVQQFQTNGYGYGYTGGNGYAVPTTTSATNVTSISATLNGIATLPQQNFLQSMFQYGTQSSVYFEYGTSQNCFQQYVTTYSPYSSCTQQTSMQVANAYSTNYNSTISVLPGTTYYYRIVTLSNGQPSFGSLVSFTTLSNIITPPTVVPDQPVRPIIINSFIPGTTSNGNDSGSNSVSLNVMGSPQTVSPGNSINYVITYQNTRKDCLKRSVECLAPIWCDTSAIIVWNVHKQ